MKKRTIVLIILALLLSSIVYAEGLSFEQLGISEIKIPLTYYLLDEKNADNSMTSKMLYDSITNLQSNVPIIFISEEDVFSCIVIEPGDKIVKTSPGFLLDKATEEEFSLLKEQLTDSSIPNIEIVTVSGHKFIKSMTFINGVSTLSYSMILNGLPVSFRLSNFAGNVSSDQEEGLYDMVESATFIIESEKSGIEKFFSSVFDFIKSYIGETVSENLIWWLIGLAALVIWGVIALVAKIFKPRKVK